MRDTEEAGTFPPYSYLICDRLFSPPANVARVELQPGRYLYFTKDQDFAARSSHSVITLFILGLCIDPETEGSSLQEIASQLHAAFANDQAFLDITDRLVGRYIIGFRGGPESDLFLMSDATGMTKINYSTEGGAASSNIFLLSREAYQHDEPQYRDAFLGPNRAYWRFGSLGNLSPIQATKILTPNHCLNLDRRRISRIFPRQAPGTHGIKDVTDHIRHSAAVQLRSLMKSHTLFQSLTAGLDSRVTLALSAGAKDQITYFTYCFKPDSALCSEVTDMKFSAVLARKLGLRHMLLFDKFRFQDFELLPSDRIIELRDEELERYTAFAQRFVWYRHIPQAPAAYRMLVANDHGKNPLHIRSNIYEIARSFWKGPPGARHTVDAGDLLAYSRRDWAAIPWVRNIFLATFTETALNRASLKGYNVLDMFYWEHRCGTWVSEVIQASDYALNTHCLLNSRKMLGMLLSLDETARSEATAFWDIIGGALPALRNIPRNPTIDLRRQR